MKLDPVESLEDAMRSIQLAIELLHSREAMRASARRSSHGYAVMAGRSHW